MENSRRNYTTSMWFNTKLFTFNGAPLKFHLEGYGFTEFHEIVRIIEAFGGQLSTPEDPDTFIFCQSDYSAGVGKCDLYDIQYFQESIVARRLQDLIKYKVRGTVNQQSASYKNDDNETNSCHNEIHREQKRNLTDDDCIDLCSSDSEYLNGPRDEKNSRACDNSRKTERFSDVGRRNENEIAGPSKTHQMNDSNDVDYDQIYGEIYEISSEDDQSHDDSDVPQTIDNSNSSTTEESNDESVTPHRHSLPSKEVEKKKRRKRSKIIFSEEDNQTIIKWLMKKKVIPTLGCLKIWQTLSNEKILPNPCVTQWILRRHFQSILSKHPNYIKYIKDAETSGRIRKCISRNRYTEKENRVMIQYLIDNDAILQARCINPWIQCLQLHKSLFHSSRTAESLRQRYVNVLRFEYERYTDDPVSLRKFKISANSIDN